MGEPRAEPTNAQSQDSGVEAPPFDRPVFPSQPQSLQHGRPQAQSPSGLTAPPPGGLTQSPEELTRQIGWTALSEAVTKSAVALYPNDPQAVAIIVATTLQPYMAAFTPMGRNSLTVGNAAGSDQHTPHSKTTESIGLGAITGNKSHEVAKYQHTFPTFPGDRCRDDTDLWEKYWEAVYGFRR